MMRCATNVASLCLLLALFMLSTGAELVAEEPRPIGATISRDPGATGREPIADEPRPVDLAICLDTSGSMSGLIESAKQKLWSVVNELVQATPTPYLRVALIQYGNDGIHPETGWVEKKLGLTTDLDEVYKQLFALTTSGGTEYVARAMTVAREQLEWTPHPDALKIIFVCGNEPATQDPEITVEQACKATITQGIIVNSIFCGNVTEGEQTGWLTVARLADGRYAAIDQEHGVVRIATPMDDELAKLSSKLNDTYLPYGEHGVYGATNQAAQDANAATMSPGVAAERAVAKAGTQYRNARWDLVDANQQEDFDLATIPIEQLPEEMQQMSLEGQQAHIEEMAAERALLEEQIAELGRQRQDFIAAEINKQGLDDEQSLDAAIRAAIRQQAAANGFTFPAEHSSQGEGQ